MTLNEFLTKPLRSDSDPSLAHARPFLVSFIVNTVLGFVIYFLALAQSEPPAWAIGWIEHLKPTVEVLDTAARISDRPFPAQVMILYTPLSAIALAAYFTYCAFFAQKIRQALYKRIYARVQEFGLTTKLRLQCAGLGVFCLILSLFVYPVVFLVQDPTSVSWRAVGFFSPSIGSAAYLLLLSGAAALFFLAGLGYFYLSISSFKSSEQRGR